MYDLILISHGRLAEEALKTAKMVFGEPPGVVHALGFRIGESQDELRSRIVSLIEDSAERGGSLVVCDVLGGSPFLASAQAYAERASECPVEVVSGFNLGMVLEAISAQGDTTLADAKNMVVAAAEQSIKVLSDSLR